jgi:hypothetical protein
LPAVRAKLKVLVQFPAAPGTDPKGLVGERNGGRPSALVKNPAAAVALQKNFPALDRKERDKEKTEIMIQALQAS